MQTEFIVVGAGIAGASLAYELAGEASVLLLEAESQPGTHATGRSAAFFSASQGNRHVRALTAASRGFFETPPAGFVAAPLLEPRGCLIFAGPDEESALKAQYEALRGSCAGLRLESGDFARTLVPVLKPEAVRACVWEPDAQRIDVAGLLEAYLRGLRQRGGRVATEARLIGARLESHGWRLDTTAGAFRGRVLVNAAGAWADQVAKLAGAEPLGLRPLRRTACIVETARPADAQHWPAVGDFGESFYFVPESGRLLLSPADETPLPPGDVYPEDLDIALAVDRLETVTTLQVKGVSHSWAGLRTVGPDRTPVAGFDPGIESFFWLAGQGGHGIQTAPALAALAGALLTRRPPPPSVAAVDTAALSPAKSRGQN